MADLKVTSEHFDDGGDIPAAHAHSSAGGDNVSPALSWEGVPAGTASFAIVCWDPDAPTTVGFTHWVRFGIAPNFRSLEIGAPAGDATGRDGITDWGETGWGGMAPPPGDPPHRYQFTVYALDAGAADLGLDERTTNAKLQFLTRGHVLATGKLTGRFGVAG
jgi:Raf kinase inhibitor-like YbhB/YbcL family protein